jgi:hypothetical protein
MRLASCACAARAGRIKGFARLGALRHALRKVSAHGRCHMASMLRDEFQTLKQDIRSLRDEVKLKVHLAGMDLQTEWQKLEPRAELLLRETGAATAGVAEDVKKRLEEFKRRLELKRS